MIQSQRKQDQETTFLAEKGNLLTHAAIRRSEIKQIEVPKVVNLNNLPNWYERNRAITNWYHQIDLALSEYLGGQEFPTWARFAKHASYNAGLQLANMQEVLEAFESLDKLKKSALDAIKLKPRFIINLLKAIQVYLKESSDVFRRDQKDLVPNGILLAFSELNIKTRHSRFVSPAEDAVQRMTPGIIIQCLIHHRRLFTGTDSLRSQLRTLFDAVEKSNQDIYTFMAPRLTNFLRAYNNGDDYFENASSDSGAEFLNHALRLYEQVHLINQNQGRSQADSRLMEATRIKVLTNANVFATFGEQQSRVQPRLAEVAGILQKASAYMRFVSPIGERRLLFGSKGQGNWADLYTRMGINPDGAPKDWSKVSINNFPSLRDEDDPMFFGTIGELLVTGTRDPQKLAALIDLPQTVQPVRSAKII